MDLNIPHQCHKAHASANVPHLDGFVSGAREQEGAWFTTLLALTIHKKKLLNQTINHWSISWKLFTPVDFCLHQQHHTKAVILMGKKSLKLKLKILVAIIVHQKQHPPVKSQLFSLKRSAKNDAVENTHCHNSLVILGQLLQRAIIALIWQGYNWIHMRSQGMKEGIWADLKSCWYSICELFCTHTLFISRFAHMVGCLRYDVQETRTHVSRRKLCLHWYVSVTLPFVLCSLVYAAQLNHRSRSLNNLNQDLDGKLLVIALMQFSSSD